MHAAGRMQAPQSPPSSTALPPPLYEVIRLLLTSTTAEIGAPPRICAAFYSDPFELPRWLIAACVLTLTLFSSNLYSAKYSIQSSR